MCACAHEWVSVCVYGHWCLCVCVRASACLFDSSLYVRVCVCSFVRLFSVACASVTPEISRDMQS